MRKIFFALAATFACLMIYTTTAAAKDVYLSTNGDGSKWFIMDETIEGDDGKFKWTNAELKLVAKDGSFQIFPWKFTQIKSDGDRLANWIYEIYLDDGRIYTEDVLAGTNAEKILLYCLNHLGM